MPFIKFDALVSFKALELLLCFLLDLLTAFAAFSYEPSSHPFFVLFASLNLTLNNGSDCH
jgi:hypothetical protein